MDLPVGTTVGGFEILTTADQPLRTYFPPKFLYDGKTWACLSVIPLNIKLDMSDLKTQYVIRVKSLRTNSMRSANAEITFNHNRAAGVDSYNVIVNNFSAKFRNDNNFKVIKLAGAGRIYMALDGDDVECRVDVTNITSGEYNVNYDDYLSEPFFVGNVSLDGIIPTEDEIIPCHFNNLANLYYHARPTSSVTITDGTAKTIACDSILSSNINLTTLPYTGVYRIKGLVALKGIYSSTSKLGILKIMVNGSASRETTFDQSQLVSTNYLLVRVEAIISLPQNSSIGLQIELQSNTGTITVDATRTLLSIEQVG